MTDKGQVERSFSGSRRAASRELARLCAEAKAGRLTSTNRTVAELLDEWMTQLESLGRAPKTLAENKREIETRIKPASGKLRLEHPPFPWRHRVRRCDARETKKVRPRVP
jgi:hypothetical protein